MPRFLLLCTLLAVLAGCERPFVEPAAPTLEVLEPADLGTVRTEPRLPLAFRASSQIRAVDRVEVNGAPVTYFRQEDVYLDTLLLEIGLNAIHVATYDASGTAGEDTLYAVYLPYQFATLTGHLPTATGGHAATRLADGAVLVTGGAPGASRPAHDRAFRIDARTFAVTEVSAPLVAARTGHTSSRLPDGRVLILGGSVRPAPELPEELVTAAEVFDPATRAFTEVPVENEDGTPALPIRRTDHTTAVLTADGETMVYLYGGLGPRFDGEAIVPIEFIRTFRFEPGPGRLVAVGPRERFRITPAAGHTQTPLEDVGADGFGRYLVAGASLPDASGPATPFVFTFAPGALGTDEVGPAAPRTDHAAERFGRLVLLAGGRDPGTAVALRDGEVFAWEARRFFRFGDAPRPNVPRWGHTATNLGDGRILLVGGFSASGDALGSSELFLPR